MTIVINLSALIEKSTGHSVCINNIVPGLSDLRPTLLLTSGMRKHWQRLPFELPTEQIPSALSPSNGPSAYAARLVWNQLKAPNLLSRLGAELFYSPLPELPLGTEVPTVATVYDFIPFHHSAKNSLGYRYTAHYVPRVLRQANHVIAISQFTADEAMKLSGIPASKITVTPLAYDSGVFRFLDLTTLPYVLFVGRQPKYKNVETALKAFAAVSNQRDYEFVIAGPEDRRYTPILRRLGRELGIRLRFVSYPTTAELAVLMNQASVLVHVSLSEGFGLTVLEAMACGTPVIASNTTSIPEVTGSAALLVDPTSEIAIKQAIEIVLTDSATGRELSDNGLKRAQKFSWESTTSLTREVLLTQLS